MEPLVTVEGLEKFLNGMVSGLNVNCPKRLVVVHVIVVAWLRTLWNTLTLLLQMPCTDVTVLQVTCILVVITFGSLLNSWQSCYDE